MYMSAHIHIYTHTHTKCTYERTQSTSETRARQRLRRKPNLTPRSSVLLPVRCNLEGDTLCGQQPNYRAVTRGTTDKCRTTTTNSSSSHHHDSAPSRPHPLICIKKLKGHTYYFEEHTLLIELLRKHVHVLLGT